VGPRRHRRLHRAGLDSKQSPTPVLPLPHPSVLRKPSWP
jgi:hypothetical protein